jgi:FkbM family methyltransferase
MSVVISRIQSLLEEAKGKESFLDVLFGSLQKPVKDGQSIVLFGSGALGQEMLYTLLNLNIHPVAFCDNNTSLHGKLVGEIPVISPEQLKEIYADSYVIICITKYENIVAKQLTQLGINPEFIFRKDSSSINKLIAMFAMVGTQAHYQDISDFCSPSTILGYLESLGNKLDKAYECYQEQKSKDIFIYKLAILASGLQFYLFKKFMLLYSEPTHEFGLLGYEGTPEDYYYFNNDVLNIEEGEVYLDVGAYDGDTVQSFVRTCNQKDVSYERIIAIEPDPKCYGLLERNTRDYKNTATYQVGFWHENGQINFVTSEEAIHDQAGNITSDVGDEKTVTIKVHRIDDFLNEETVTFIKMDPSGDIVNQVLLGGTETIKAQKPKLALGVYHSLEEFIEVPILLKKWCPEYNLFLRHNTYHLCDTDLYAYVG